MKTRLAGLLAVLLAVGLSTAVRIHGTAGDPHFDAASPRGILKTDPALLHYVTQRIVDAGGLPPDDFRSDPRLEWPEASDLPAMFTVGQEFAVAWFHLLLGEGAPLHVRAVWLMAAWTSLGAVGAYLLARELAGSAGWGAFAAVLWALLPANYRTVGFVLVREDFAFPFFALHLGLLARAVRVRSGASIALAALAALGAAATWHASGFFLLMEVACLALWFLRTGENPAAAPRAWLAVAVLGVGSLAIPVLLAKQFLLSLSMQVLAGLFAAGAWRRWRGDARGERLVFAGTVAVLAAAAALWSRLAGGGARDYAHVVEFVLAKLVRLGRLPADPAELSFGTILLWQGPFATAPPEVFTLGLTVGLPALLAGLVLAAPAWLRGRREDGLPVLVALVALSAVATWLIVRVQILPGLLVPVLVGVLLARLRSQRLALGLAGLALVAQAGLLQRLVVGQPVEWYSWPGPERIAEREHLIDWISANVPEGDAIAADFLNSAAIVAFTGHPVVQQPKYETARSRERIQVFSETFFQGSPLDLHALLTSWRTRWLVVDRPWLANNCVLGGVSLQEFFQRGPRPGTAAASFISNDPRVFAGIPGFRLHYQSPPQLRFRSFAVYELGVREPAQR